MLVKKYLFIHIYDHQSKLVNTFGRKIFTPIRNSGRKKKLYWTSLKYSDSDCTFSFLANKVSWQVTQVKVASFCIA